MHFILRPPISCTPYNNPQEAPTAILADSRIPQDLYGLIFKFETVPIEMGLVHIGELQA